MRINEAAKLTGVTVRTLQYYDKIDLLKPVSIAANGYREYDEECLKKLQEILLLKEFDFSIKEIKGIITHKDFDSKDVLQKQKCILIEKRKRLDKIIGLLEKNILGVENLSFNEFSMEEIDNMKNKYAEEVKKRWGNTEEYRQSQVKTEGRTDKENSLANKGVDEFMKKFSLIRSKAPNSAEVQELVAEWKGYITPNYYECTDEILMSLAHMYTEDERFKENIDFHGDGTAEFIRSAIECYCNQ